MPGPPYHPTSHDRAHPAHFARHILGLHLWKKQRQVLEALAATNRVAVKSGNGLGKSLTAAAALLWFTSTHDPSITLSTAPTARQVKQLLWREIARLYASASYDLGGDLTDIQWELSPWRYALGLTSDDATTFQGFHSPNILIIVDEAAGVPDPIYEAIEAVTTSANAKILLIGNPTSITGTFRRAFYEERHIYHTITMSALDSPNVHSGKHLIKGLVTREWVEQRKEIWGEDSAAYRARVLGEFPDQAEDTLIALSWAEAATQRPPQPGDERKVLGVDVARYGQDKSVILLRNGYTVTHITQARGQDTMTVAGMVKRAIEEHQPASTLIDEIGIGAGVVDRLKEQEQPVRGVNVGEQARDKTHYANVRAEGYWTLRHLFQDGLISIPDDAELIGQLTSIKFSYDSLGRVRIEPKEQARKRGLPSPDKADALMLAFLSIGHKVQLWV